MCGRYGLTASLEEIAERFGAVQLELPIEPRYNAAPSQEMPVVRPDGELDLMRWGYSPGWMREQGGKQLINARAETLFTSRTFKDAATTDRVLVPASFYYEWDRGRQPYLFRLRDQELFGFAGLRFQEDGEDRFVIVTTSPNELAGRVHDRMPAILRREDEEVWLSPDESDPERLGRTLLPIPSDLMESYPVSRRVNSPSNDSAELVRPVS